MAGLKIKASGPIALVDRAGGPQISGNDIAPSLGHTNLASGEVRLSHFFAGYGNLGLGTTGFGDGYKLWQNGAGETETVPNLQSTSPAEIEADGDDVPELKFSDFYDVRQQNTSAISVVEARFNATSHTNVLLYGFAQQSIFAQSTGNDSFGLGQASSYNYNYRESMCGINGATTAGWKITGMYAQKTSANVNRQFLHMQWDAGSGSVPTRANSGWSAMDVGRWNGTSRSASGLPNLTETAQMQRTACLFVANQGTGKSYWQQTYGDTSNSTVTIYQHASTYGTTNWYMILLDEFDED